MMNVWEKEGNTGLTISIKVKRLVDSLQLFSRNSEKMKKRFGDFLECIHLIQVGVCMLGDTGTFVWHVEIGRTGQYTEFGREDNVI